jgi:hypothetical protein
MGRPLFSNSGHISQEHRTPSTGLQPPSNKTQHNVKRFPCVFCKVDRPGKSLFKHCDTYFKHISNARSVPQFQGSDTLLM